MSHFTPEGQRMFFLSNPRRQQASKSSWIQRQRIAEGTTGNTRSTGIHGGGAGVLVSWVWHSSGCCSRLCWELVTNKRYWLALWPVLLSQYQPLPLVCCLVKVFQCYPSPVRDKVRWYISPADEPHQQSIWKTVKYQHVLTCLMPLLKTLHE